MGKLATVITKIILLNSRNCPSVSTLIIIEATHATAPIAVKIIPQSIGLFKILFNIDYIVSAIYLNDRSF